MLLLCISLSFTYEAQAKLCMEALHSERGVHDRSPKTYAACRAQDSVINRSSTAPAADTQDSQNIDHLNVAVCPPKGEAGSMLSTRPTLWGGRVTGLVKRCNFDKNNLVGCFGAQSNIVRVLRQILSTSDSPKSDSEISLTETIKDS